MKNISFLFIALICFAGATNLTAQEQQDTVFRSFCAQPELKIASNEYQMWYTYTAEDSTLLIKGNLGHENCGIQHLFSVHIDSNLVTLTETIVDTLLATCHCFQTIEIKIDSFCYEEFNVIFEGELISNISENPVVSEIKAFPNPVTNKINLFYPETLAGSYIEIFDVNGKIVEQRQLTGFNQVLIDMTNYQEGIYLIKFAALGWTKTIVKE